MSTEYGTRSGPHRLRTSDAEREEVAQILRAAMSEGRLTLAEGEERLAAAYAATFRDELTPLTADLPGNGRDAHAQKPENREYARSRLRRHGAFVAVLAAALVGLWALSAVLWAPGPHFFWPVIPLVFLAIGFARHARWHRHGYGRPWRVSHEDRPPWG